VGQATSLLGSSDYLAEHSRGVRVVPMGDIHKTKLRAVRCSAPQFTREVTGKLLKKRLSRIKVKTDPAFIIKEQHDSPPRDNTTFS